MSVQFENSLNRSDLLKENMWLIKDGALRQKCLYASPSNYHGFQDTLDEDSKRIISKENVKILSNIAIGNLKLDCVSSYSESLLLKESSNLSEQDIHQGIIAIQYSIQSKSYYYKNTLWGIITKLFLTIFGMWNSGTPSSIARAIKIRNKLIELPQVNKNTFFRDMINLKYCDEGLVRKEEITAIHNKKTKHIVFLAENCLFV